MALSDSDRYEIWRAVYRGASKERIKAAAHLPRIQEIHAALDGLEAALTTAATDHKAAFDAALGQATTGAIYRDFVMALLRNKAGRG